ncbi:hypothetical protein CIG75_15740 [Tumebacillus algifaecis]|uniref:Uncharacterized protein n=1 Tax=Tumebacillus algifaecis TaxID=1214604 RepID=A0A223D3Y2_9BACL|nr:hypothetical protein [Tumebacillus algifaecis]ASS76250.1 hypothetical protein CIG75_15740 [Tumebacillus algifaecis]
MKKMPVALMLAATVFAGVATYTVPAQAATNSVVKPELDEGMVKLEVYFSSYPPNNYSDENTGFNGWLVGVTPLPNGQYKGTYYGYMY